MIRCIIFPLFFLSIGCNSSKDVMHLPKNSKVKSIYDLPIESFIIKYPPNYKDEFTSDMEYYKTIWKERENPIIARYRGNDIGDYFHINFEGENGEGYDFAYAKNHFGKYKLFDNSLDYNDNPKYLNKKFKIFWALKIAKFPCCSGDFEEAEAYIPTITKLELIKE